MITDPQGWLKSSVQPGYTLANLQQSALPSAMRGYHQLDPKIHKFVSCGRMHLTFSAI